jgi:hypothetical protein
MSHCVVCRNPLRQLGRSLSRIAQKKLDSPDLQDVVGRVIYSLAEKYRGGLIGKITWNRARESANCEGM